MTQHGTDAEAIISATKALFIPQVVDVGGQKVLVTQSTQTINSVKDILDEYLTAPERKQGTATLHTLQALIDFANRGKDSDSVIFANKNTPSLTVVLDYNPAGPPANAARFGEHLGVYKFPLSEEWVTWTAGNKQVMSQKGFAEFIEGRIADIADGSNPGDRAKDFADRCGVHYSGPSTLLEVSKGLELHANVVVKQAQKLASGESQFSFVETHEHKGGGLLNVPGAFLIAIPVFRGGTAYQIPIRLRYRLTDGSVKWFYEIYRADVFLDHAFDTACKEAGDKTGLTVLYGTPEE